MSTRQEIMNENYWWIIYFFQSFGLCPLNNRFLSRRDTCMPPHPHPFPNVSRWPWVTHFLLLLSMINKSDTSTHLLFMSSFSFNFCFELLQNYVSVTLVNSETIFSPGDILYWTFRVMDSLNSDEPNRAHPWTTCVKPPHQGME